MKLPTYSSLLDEIYNIRMYLYMVVFETFTNGFNLGQCEHSPIKIRIETTNRCNLECVTCPLNWKDYTRKKETMSVDLFKRIINEASNFRPKPSVVLYIGGEPLMNSRIIDMIDIAKDEGLYCTLNSNAALMTEEISHRLIASKIDQIEFSFDDLTKEEYEAMRINANYDVTLENIRRFLDIKSSQGATFPRVVITGIRMKDKDLVESVEEIMPSERYRSLFDGHDVRLSVYYAHKWSKGKNSSFRPCRFPIMDFNILSNGLCVPCCYDLNGDFVLGNLNESSILEIWNNAEYRSLRKKMILGRRHEIGICGKCPL